VDILPLPRTETLPLPCAGAFLIVIFATSLGVADAATRLLSFVAYGFGFGLPILGEQTDEILAELRYHRDEVAALRAEGAVWDPRRDLRPRAPRRRGDGVGAPG